jgi:actin-related protein
MLGFAERLEKEMKTLFSPVTWVKVIASPERKFAAWVGGSILASLSMIQYMWVTKQNYDEYGPSIIFRMWNR